MRNYKFLVEANGEMFTEVFSAPTAEAAERKVAAEYEGGRFALIGTSSKFRQGRTDNGAAIKELPF